LHLGLFERNHALDFLQYNLLMELKIGDKIKPGAR
jgi:hypothetical protein